MTMKRTGGEIIIHYLTQEKVPYILGIPGHGILGLFDAIKTAHEGGAIRYIQVKQEQAAAHIADAYYRVTGRPLAVFTSIGPGAMNTCIGLATAYVDSSAYIQLSGDTHVHMKGVGVLQEVERYQDSYFIRAMEPITKRAWRVEAVSQLPRVMRRAFQQMLTGRPGPVLLALPMDVQAASVDMELPPSESARTAAKPAGEPAAIAEAVRLMAQAKRPVILAGGAVLRSRAFDQLVALAELWGAAVVTTMAGKSAFPETHPLSGLHTGSKGTPVGLALTRTADVVLALGTRFADETTCSYKDGAAFSFPKTKLIHVDIDPSEIGKNYPCDVGILGDVALVMEQLTKAYAAANPQPPQERDAYHREMLALRAQWAATLARQRAQAMEKITITQLIGQLETCLPEDAIIATSSGNTQAQLFQEFVVKQPGTHLTTGGYSTMGWALPAAIGAKLARPQTPVLALLGDGDFMMAMQELTTLAQYDIPVVVLLVNNSGWLAIKDLQTDVLGEARTFGNDWEQGGHGYTPDFVQVAQAFGIHARRISQPDEVAGALREAFALAKPALIEVDAWRDYPLSGGEAYGWWDVPIPAHMAEKRAQYEQAKQGEQV
jgi:acetolactate synthase-1/2/3 large subunit